jgi:hypothetical protein
MSQEGWCEECKKHTDEIFYWRGEKSNKEYALCEDCVVKNNTPIK